MVFKAMHSGGTVCLTQVTALVYLKIKNPCDVKTTPQRSIKFMTLEVPVKCEELTIPPKVLCSEDHVTNQVLLLPLFSSSYIP